MRLSIIIPTYNNHISDMIRCLDSVYDTAYQDFDVLIIDDGSKVSYQVELDQVETRYERLMVLHKAHAGVSAARNFGVQKAQGDYILFVDADDVVTKQFWRDFVAILQEENDWPDVIYGMVRSGEEEKMPDCLSMEETSIYSLQRLNGKEKRKLYRHFFDLGERASFTTISGYVSRGPCARLIKRMLVQQCPFDEHVAVGEDMLWNLKILRKNPSVAVVLHVWYFYVKNMDSVTHACRPDLIEKHRVMLEELTKYGDSTLKMALWNRAFESLNELARAYFLSPQNPLSWREKVKEFNKMSYSYPFNELLENDVKMGGVKPLLKLALYRAGLLLYVYKLKMMLHR